MVFKKPYAFFIKYFRLINLILVVLFSYLIYKLNLIRQVINGIYKGNVTNYSALSSEFIGFKLYLLLFLIGIIVVAILLLLYKKNKPLKDYLYSLIYVVVILIYLLFIDSIFVTLSENIMEQTSLKLYTDISFLIIVPLIYFIFKFILIAIGFNINKFNFTNDIIELKQEEKDNEEVEVVFDKNVYKYKRGIRKSFRELKYYYLENRFLINVILIGIFSVFILVLFTLNIFKSNNVSLKENFVAGTLNYKVMEVCETRYDLNNNIVKDGSKFIIARVIVKNISDEVQTIDYKKIRLLYGEKYVYANNYFNKFFLDLGKPYDNDILKSNVSNEFIFVFKIPVTYKSNDYVLKFYDRISVENEETFGSYKELKVNSKDIDKKIKEKDISLNENTVFNKNRYKNSNLTITNYEIKNNYVYNENGETKVIRSKDVDKILLILDYKLDIDLNSRLSNYFKTDKDFFDKFICIEYNDNGKAKLENISAIGNVEGKIMFSIPLEVQNSSYLNLVLRFRDVKIGYKLK